ncbi:MAG TPA: hypothetical protein VJP40_07710, partial [bacterium]|nr:hypothetical protein [bacterium]
FFAGCGKQESPPSIFEESSEQTGTVTIFSDAPGPRLEESQPAEKPLEETKPPPRPAPGIKRKYPPPVPPEAPPAPRGPPIPPRYSLEPPPSKFKAFPDFKAEKLGIWECDDYVSQYLVCINRRVPRNEDAKLAKALEAKVKEWKAKAGNPEGRLAVVQECQSAFKRSKKAMQPYACTWR